MKRKIFISYKYADNNVYNIRKDSYKCTVRDYVDKLEEILDAHIYKGESDGEDLSGLEEDTIWAKLRDRIYDSSLTIVLVSPYMKEDNKADANQWIPWEISYSLKEISRKNRAGESITSKTNAMLTVILPDINGSYSYYTKKNKCCTSGCITFKTGTFFKILKNNMFNIIEPNKKECEEGSVIYTGNSSYIESVRWEDFESNADYHINMAYKIRDNMEDYKIVKEI